MYFGPLRFTKSIRNGKYREHLLATHLLLGMGRESESVIMRLAGERDERPFLCMSLDGEACILFVLSFFFCFQVHSLELKQGLDTGVLCVFGR